MHLEFVGASDTAGYCVDGTPDTSDLFLLCYKKKFRLNFKFSVLTVSCPFPKWTTYKISFDIFIFLKTIQITLAKTKIIYPKNVGA